MIGIIFQTLRDWICLAIGMLFGVILSGLLGWYDNE